MSEISRYRFPQGDERYFVLEENVGTEVQVVDKLMQRGFHIAFAESCTGGMLCGRLVDVPNASAVLDCSFVTYANEAKMKYLGVSGEAIATYGVVSEIVAGQMASGVAREAGAQVGVATSGIAGPTGGTEKKPVGMVCFGFYINESVTTRTVCFGDIGRNRVREAAVQYALEQLNTLLEQQD